MYILNELSFRNAMEKSQTRIESTRRLLEFLTRRNRRSPSPDSCCIVLTNRRFLPNRHTMLSQHWVARFFTFRLTSIPISLPLGSGNHLYEVPSRNIFLFSHHFFYFGSWISRTATYPLFASIMPFHLSLT